MSEPRFDITPFLSATEGQHFERKSLFEGEPGKKKPRDRKEVRDQIADCVAAFANAEGGVAIFGIENDGSATGHKYPAEVVEEMLRVPSSRVQPPLANGFRVTHENVELLVFEVTISDAPVMVTGNGYPLRVGDTTVKMEEPKIRALKIEGLADSWVNRPSQMTLADLDSELLVRAKIGAGYPNISDEEFLLKRKLADRKGSGTVLRRAAELLFAREPDHPNAGIRIFRVLGTERRVGVDYNVEERPRVEGPLPRVLSGVFDAIQGLLRKPARLRGSRFTPTPEYPEFAWKEAILNAVAHRDYGNQGRSIEVSLFEDHMEVTSPGGLLAEISLESLRARRRVHQSRNPRLVRVLVDLGYMRDQGEGIPRLYSEMEGLFLPEPELEATANSFQLTLRNTPTLTTSDRAFIASLGSDDLTDLEFRALLEASRHGRVDNARMRQIAGLDTLGASKLLGGLRDRSLLVLHPAGSSSYYELAKPFAASNGTESSDADALIPKSDAALPPMPGEGRARDALASGEQGELPGIGTPVSSGRNSRQFGAELPSVRGGTPVSSQTRTSRADKTRERIRAVCSDWKTPAEIASALSIRSTENLTRRHLGPMVEARQLVRRYEDKNHPGQAYRAAGDESGGSR